MPTPSPSSADDAPAACANCGAPLSGPYCARCGQSAEDPRKPVRAFLSDVGRDILALDSRLTRTIVPLFFRPGRLTVEYLAGRREPYVPPLRLYMFASVVFFGLVALVGARPIDVQIGSAAVDEARISDTVNAAASYLHFFFVPAFAGLVMLLFGRRLYYVEHLVFALHFGAFAFLGLVLFAGAARAASGGPTPNSAGSAIMAAWTVALVAYLLIALRRVYGRPWGGTVLRAGALGILYTIAFAIGMVLVTLVAYWIV